MQPNPPILHHLRPVQKSRAWFAALQIWIIWVAFGLLVWWGLLAWTFGG